eukprot:1646908-Heterocapsa_arctica.AAC.1
MFDEEYDLRIGISANKQARKRAKQMQDEVNKNKRTNNIEAHQKRAIFESPNTVTTRKEEMTHEQTNH